MSVKESKDLYSENEISSWFKKKSFKEIAKDLKRCLKFILEQKDTKSSDVFTSFLSSKLAESRVDSDFEKIKCYCSFIVCVSFAVLDVFPFNTIIEKNLDNLIVLASNKNLGFAFQVLSLRLLLKGAKSKNELPEENFKKHLLNDIVELHSKVNLKSFWKNKTERLAGFKTGLTHFNGKLKLLSKGKCSVGKSKSTQKLIYYTFDLFREFQLKTWIEHKSERGVFSLLIEVLESLFNLLKFHRSEIVSKLIKYWPTCFQYQSPVITVFMKFCKQLTTDEQKSIEKILVQKFDELLIYSQSKVFERAYDESKNLSTKFIGFTNRLGKSKGIYENNMFMAAMKAKSYVGKKSRKESILKAANEEQKKRKRKSSETTGPVQKESKISKSDLSSILNEVLQKSNIKVPSSTSEEKNLQTVPSTAVSPTPKEKGSTQESKPVKESEKNETAKQKDTSETPEKN